MQIILSYLFIEKHTTEVLTVSAQSFASEVKILVDLFEKRLSTSEIKNISKDLSIQLLESKSIQLERYGVHKNTWLYRFLKRAFQEKLKKPYFLKMDKDNITVQVVCNKSVVSFKAPIKRYFTNTTIFVVLGTFLASLLLFTIAFLFMKNQIRSIIKLTKAVEQLGLGEDPKDFKPDGALEIRRAGYAFLTMKERLTKFIQNRMDMLLGVSHDLRTPLTRMKLLLACEELPASLKDLEIDISQMEKMVESFLAYAKSNQIETTETVSLKQLILDVIKEIQPFEVKLDCSNNSTSTLKPLTFKRAISNVLLNSKKFGKKASVKVITNNGFIKIIIQDDGPGIDEGEISNVLKPFYRIDSSRNLDSGGVGLGLSIVQDCISAHGGKLHLVPNPKINSFSNSTLNLTEDCYSELKGLKVIFFIPQF